MDILGIGIPELGFIILIAIIVLGPKDMQKAGKTVGKWMRKIVLSPEWREIKNASRQIKQLPTQLMREANLEEFEKYKRDIGIDTPTKDHLGKLDDATAPYGSWSGMSVHKKAKAQNKIAPNVDNKLAPVKKTDSAPETSTVNTESDIENKNA